MRYYEKVQEKKLEKVICNKCGKELTVENGIVKEGCFAGKQEFGYFSSMDASIHSFDLCEDCYLEWIRSFSLPVSVEAVTEL